MAYLKNILIAADQMANAVLGGWPDETLSSWAFRTNRDGKPWGFLRHVIDAIFFWQPEHCMGAYESERKRRQLAPEFR